MVSDPSSSPAFGRTGLTPTPICHGAQRPVKPTVSPNHHACSVILPQSRAWRERVMGFEVGRIGRAHYWGLVVLLLIGRALLSKVLGPVPMCLGGLALIYVLLSARFHDFGAPSWLGG